VARLIELPELRGRIHVFKDRAEGGRVLAAMLEGLRGRQAVVLGIPSGGVAVGVEVAQALELPFDVVVSRKVPIPEEPEAGFGAVSAEGDLFLNQKMLLFLGISPEEAASLAESVREEVRRREARYRGGRPLPELAGKVAVVVDDGLATGYTALACLAQVRRRNPEKLLLAVPTASLSAIERVGEAADEIYCANVRSTRFFAVAEAYRHWRDLTASEVLALLKGRDARK
jgi:predicted phosphoribosyltransferase